MEIDQLFSHLSNHGNLLGEETVQVRNVLLNVGARLVYIIKKSHFLFDEVNDIVDVVTMASNEFLLFFEDLLDQTLMFSTKLISITGVFSLKVLNSRDSIIQLHLFIVQCWFRCLQFCLLLSKSLLLETSLRLHAHTRSLWSLEL